LTEADFKRKKVLLDLLLVTVIDLGEIPYECTSVLVCSFVWSEKKPLICYKCTKAQYKLCVTFLYTY